MNFLPKIISLHLSALFVRTSLILLFFISSAGFAQERPVRAPGRPTPQQADTTRRNIPADSIPSLAADTAKTAQDSIPPKGDIETTINYSARDSIFSSVDGKMVWLYGAAKIVYGQIELEAEEIIIDYANSTLTAHGTRDSLGQRVGYPVFKEGGKIYEMKDIVYNFKTSRARITEVVTEESEGYLHGGTVFKNEKNEMLSLNNRYTTCSLEHPHFAIISTRTKAIPNDKIVSGPFYMEFNDIPTPLGFLFGMFPAQRESKSGIIVPSYGEERVRGFNLRNGGYFFDINDYVKLTLTGDIYSKGGHALYANTNYTKRYKYSGSFNLSYSKLKNVTNIEDPSTTNDYRLTWSHSPKSRGTGRFSASVSAATSTFNQNNNLFNRNFTDYDPNSSQFNNVSRKLTSNISYNKTFAGTPFSMGINVNHNQDLITNQVDLTLPTLSVNMRNLYPLQNIKTRKTSLLLDNFNVSYTMAAVNRISNNLGRIPQTATRDSIGAFNLETLPTYWQNGKKGMRHSIPVATSFKLLKHFTVSPSFNYEERWYGEKLVWSLDEADRAVIVDTINGFNRVFNYSMSAGINTRIYGFFPINKGKVKAIRHVINPNMSIGYTPNFGASQFDYYQKLTTSQNRVIYKSRYEGFAYGGPGIGESGSIGFGIGNTLEMKVQSDKDSVARKVSILNNLSISSSYNLVADSFKLANIGISANTNILNNLINLNFSGTIDPYKYLDNRRIDEYVFKDGKIGLLRNANVAFSTNLNPKGRQQDTESRDKIAQSNLPEAEKNFYLQNPNSYVDFDIPWNLRLNYSLNYQNGIGTAPNNITQNMSFNGDLSLSEKWKITYSAAYDFENKEIVNAHMTVARDLHCWTLFFDWVPFGRFTSYNFRINVKASVLQDLKLERRKPFFDNL